MKINEITDYQEKMKEQNKKVLLNIKNRIAEIENAKQMLGDRFQESIQKKIRHGK